MLPTGIAKAAGLLPLRWCSGFRVTGDKGTSLGKSESSQENSTLIFCLGFLLFQLSTYPFSNENM